MAEERKKPKIDLKTRIPSKTVKGLNPSSGSGSAIPPPPGAVPAPPPDLLGRRSMPPQVSVDPNDPLGAAQVHGGHQKQQVIVVEASPQDTHAASKKGTFYAIVGGVLVIGGVIGFVSGSASAKGDRKSHAISEVKDLQAKIDKTDKNFEQLLGLLDTATSELNNDNLTQGTIDGIKNFSSGFSAADLKAADLAYLGEDTGLKVVSWANKVNHLDQMRAQMTRGNHLETIQGALKTLTVPGKMSKYGIQLERPSNDMPISIASIVDFGEPLDPKGKIDKADPKAPKLTAKSGALDVYPGKGDFFDKGFVSPIMGSEWAKACGVRGYVANSAKADLDELTNSIKGNADDKGVIDMGKELSDKLKVLAK
ncbi:MAG: hypothetical protein NVSMB47_16030 [Polyangiales bacterium]